MAEAKIKTLYSDKEKTEKLYPRTKIGAISDNDGVGLEAILDNMVYSGDVAVESVQASLPVDADTLGGNTPDYYVTKADLQSQIDNITPAQIGAAPAGYGLGGPSKAIYTNDRFDDMTANGWYTWATQNTDPNKPFDAGAMLVVTRTGTQSTTQIAFRYNSAHEEKVRHQGYDGVWGEWEWVNPPMALGVEYRTTERYDGLPVYVKALDFMALPSSGAGFIETDLNLRNIISMNGIAIQANGGNRMDMKCWGRISDMYTQGSRLYVTVTDDASGYNGRITIKYYK